MPNALSSSVGQVVFFALIAFSVRAQDIAEIDIVETGVGDGLYFLKGGGGNLALSVGADGVLLVDDQFAPLSEKILRKIESLGGGNPEFIINTHWHGDHTGGNENFARNGAVIVAHDNVRQRMSSHQRIKILDEVHEVQPRPELARPVVTISAQASVHFNGDTLRIIHGARAHTDGDVLVHFERANVLHMGDAFFNGRYPFIDLSSGGSIGGLIDLVNRGLALADEETVVIPGHGALSDKDGLEAYADMLITLRDRISRAKAAGQSLAEIVKSKPGAQWDESHGQMFIKPEHIVQFIYESL